MSQDDFDLDVYLHRPGEVPDMVFPALLAAPEAGSFVDPEEVFRRLGNHEDALPSAHPNGTFTVALNTVLPETKVLPPAQHEYAVLDDDSTEGVWFVLEVLDQDLVEPVYDGEYDAKDVGRLLSARILLKKMVSTWGGASPGQLVSWRLVKVASVRPNPAEGDEVHTWLPVSLWVDNLRFPFPGRTPQPVLSLGWTKKAMERLCMLPPAEGRLRQAVLKHGTTRGLIVRLFSAQELQAKGPTGRALTTGKRVASFHPRGHELEVDLAARMAAWRKDAPPPPKPKKEPTPLEKLGFVLPQYDDTSRPIGTTGYRLLVRPPLTRVAVGHSMRFVCQADPTLRELQFLNLDWHADKVEFGVFDEEKNLVAYLPPKLGRLSHDGQEQLLEGTAPTDGAVEVPQDRFVVRTFETPGRFAVVCGVTPQGTEDPLVAAHEVEVCSVDAILSTSMEKGLAEGMPDPGQAYLRAKTYCAALEVVAAGDRELDLFPADKEEAHREEVRKLTEYAQALGNLLTRMDLALQPFPGAYGLPYLSDMGAIKCETWLCPSGEEFGPLAKKLGGKLGWAKNMLELKVCLARAEYLGPGKKVRMKLLDWSDPQHAKFSGVHEATEDDLVTATRNVIKKWVRDSGHPNGRYRVQVSAPFNLVVELEKTTSLMSELAEWAGYIAAAATVLAMCLTGFGAPAGVATAATVLALVAGVASSALSIVDRQQYGALGWTRADVVDLLDIAGSLCSFGATRWTKAAQIAIKANAAEKAQKLRLYAKIATVGETTADLLQGVLVLEEEADTLDQLLGASGLTPGERLAKLIKLLGACSNLSVMGLRSSLLELDGIDEAAKKLIRQRVDALKDPAHLLTAGGTPTTTTHTNEGEVKQTVTPKKNQPALLVLPRAGQLQPKLGEARWNGKGYDPPAEFGDVFARPELAATAKPGACGDGAELAAKRVFVDRAGGSRETATVLPDVLQALPAGGNHRFSRVRRAGKEDVVLDHTLYQFFSTKKGEKIRVDGVEIELKGTPTELDELFGPNRPRSLESVGLPPFEGSWDDLQQRIWHLSEKHPFLKLKDEYLERGPVGLFESFWGSAREAKPLRDGQTLHFRDGIADYATTPYNLPPGGLTPLPIPKGW